MTDRRQITEDLKIHEDWYKQAKAMTLEKLPEFLRHLTENYGHDYGTICHAIAASAIAAAWAVNHAPEGGITGFQASCIMWEFISHWMGLEGKPLRMLHYENMLYPQYESNFGKQISADTWRWLQEEARKKLAERDAFTHPDVKAHWESIAAGTVPFGYTVEEDA